MHGGFEHTEIVVHEEAEVGRQVTEVRWHGFFMGLS